MNRWQRFLWGGLVSRFTDEDGSVGEATIGHGRRVTDSITPEMIRKEANNGKSTKELLVEYHYENKIEHASIRTTQWWHTKIIIIVLGAIVSGLVALIYFAVRMSLGG